MANGDVHDNSAPVAVILIGKDKVPITPAERREAGVHAHGRAFELESIMASYFGGVP